MEKCKFKNSILFLLILQTVIFTSGCQLGGIVSLLGTESYAEEKIPAEYNLSPKTDKKILVFVDQPSWLNSEANLRFNLTRAIRQNLMAKTKLTPENLITYEKLVEYRSSQPDFSSMSPIEVGKAVDANMVLLILIENFQLQKVPDSSYFMGDLNTRAILYDVQSGEKLWPKQEESKSIKVGFEIETGGMEKAVSRLAVASAYCTTRYFYNCPKARFKIPEEKTRLGWESWK